LSLLMSLIKSSITSPGVKTNLVRAGRDAMSVAMGMMRCCIASMSLLDNADAGFLSLVHTPFLARRMFCRRV
jgi:hypothetical protein